MSVFTLPIGEKVLIEVNNMAFAHKLAIRAVENVAAVYGLDYVKAAIRIAKPGFEEAVGFIRHGYNNQPSAAIAALFGRKDNEP